MVNAGKVLCHLITIAFLSDVGSGGSSPYSSIFICWKVLKWLLEKHFRAGEKWFSLVEVLSPKNSVLVDVEKGFENVLLEQVVFVYDQSKIAGKYQTYKFNEGEFSKRAYIPINLTNKYRVWMCDVFGRDIKIAEKMTKGTMFLSDISTTTRGLPLQSKLKEKGDIPVIGGKEIQRYTVIGTKGFLSKSHSLISLTKHADHQKNPAKQTQVKEYENQIDQLVYQLYDLTDKEIKIVEGETK